MSTQGHQAAKSQPRRTQEAPRRGGDGWGRGGREEQREGGDTRIQMRKGMGMKRLRRRGSGGQEGTGQKKGIPSWPNKGQEEVDQLCRTFRSGGEKLTSRPSANTGE